MHRLLIFVLTLVSAASAFAQGTRIEVQDFMTLEMDLDARVNYPQEDWNGNTCAIIKVQTSEKGFMFDTGTISVTNVVYKPGEIWVYVSEGVRKFTISHEKYGVCRYEIPIPVKGANVYLLKLRLQEPKSNGIFVSTPTITSGYLKMKIEPKNAVVFLGETENYEIATKVVTDGTFAIQLNFGDYFYKIESDLHETYYGRISLAANTPTQTIKLGPAYNYLSINSSPDQGADVTINGRYAGKTPLRYPEKVMKGVCNIKLTHGDYMLFEKNENLTGDGRELNFTYEMVPCYGMVTFTAENDAEIWIDNQFLGRGTWTGRVSSTSTHIAEARLPNHYSQSRPVSVNSGQTLSIALESPVPKYATLELTTTPSFAQAYMDGEYIGETPMISQVLVGEHQLSFKIEGYGTEKRTVSLVEHEHFRLDVTLNQGKVNPLTGAIEMEIMLEEGRYVGEVLNDVPHGKGILYFLEGDSVNRKSYEGDWVNGIREGQGTMIWVSGEKYTGSWKQGRREGYGVDYYADGRRYEGNWSGGKKSGYGIFYWNDGERYEGEWVNGLKSGQGTYYWKNGEKYVGAWANDKREGFGVDYYTNGNRYEGNWQGGKRSGYGTYYYTSGNRYEGGWKDGSRHGSYTFYWSSGSRETGNYTDGVCTGQATFYYSDGSYMIGNYVNDKKEGRWKYYRSNGSFVENRTYRDDKLVK